MATKNTKEELEATSQQDAPSKNTKEEFEAPSQQDAPSKPALKFHKKRDVTLSLIKLKNGEERYFLLEEVAVKAKPIKNGGSDKKEAPMLMVVTDLETGERGQIIVNAVLLYALNDEYPEGSYVGKSFAITRHDIDGKNYPTFSVTEIEVVYP